MKLLIDTHAFLWIISGSDKLSAEATDAFLDADNQLFFSAASYWEIGIKQSLGKLVLVDNWAQIFDQEMVANGIKWLPIEKEHCQRLSALPFIHRDPFDRMLIAQAAEGNMVLLTADANIGQYPGVQVVW